jgi:putative sigma-54 modulation protein
MNINITARHFKAHETLQEYIVGEITKLQKYYDGIIGVDVVLSYEKPMQSVKTAEVKVSVHGTILTAIEKSNDFIKSVDAAVGKIERQVKKYKSKQREKKKATLRQRQAKV